MGTIPGVQGIGTNWNSEAQWLVDLEAAHFRSLATETSLDSAVPAGIVMREGDWVANGIHIVTWT